MAFNYFDNASIIGKQSKAGINNLNSHTMNMTIGAAGWRRTTPGSYSFVVPQLVSSISVVCVGGGGGGGGSNGVSGPAGSGGGGGTLAYGTIAVTSGETLTVNVGAGGTAGLASGSGSTNGGGDGGQSEILR